MRIPRDQEARLLGNCLCGQIGEMVTRVGQSLGLRSSEGRTWQRLGHELEASPH